MAPRFPATLDLELSPRRQCFHNRRVYCCCIFIVPEITLDLHGDNVSAIGAYLVGVYSLFLKSLPIFMEMMFLRLAHTLLVHIHCSCNQTDFNGDNVSANRRISCCCIFIVPEITPDFHGDNVSAIGAYLVGAYSLFLKSLPIFMETNVSAIGAYLVGAYSLFLKSNPMVCNSSIRCVFSYLRSIQHPLFLFYVFEEMV